MKSLVPDISATNEPKKQSCDAPDYILTEGETPVGFIEAKDVGNKDLDEIKKTGDKEQFDRYKASLSKLVFTDYLDLHLHRDGEFITKISIGEIFPVSGGCGSWQSLYQRNPIFQHRSASSVEFLYWRIPTCSKMAQISKKKEN